MLMGHLEDQDEVLHCQFSDNSDDEDSEGQEKPRVRYVAEALGKHYPYNWWFLHCSG
jgi:hypothetical protein